jgi:hypothetical protein
MVGDESGSGTSKWLTGNIAAIQRMQQPFSNQLQWQRSVSETLKYKEESKSMMNKSLTLTITLLLCLYPQFTKVGTVTLLSCYIMIYEV